LYFQYVNEIVKTLTPFSAYDLIAAITDNLYSEQDLDVRYNQHGNICAHYMYMTAMNF